MKVITSEEGLEEDLEKLLREYSSHKRLSIYRNNKVLEIVRDNILRKWKEPAHKGDLIRLLGGHTVELNPDDLRKPSAAERIVARYPSILELVKDGKVSCDMLTSGKVKVGKNYRKVGPYVRDLLLEKYLAPYQICGGCREYDNCTRELRSRCETEWSNCASELGFNANIRISVLPSELLSISEFTSGWTSCHRIWGEYGPGNLLYSMDKHTIVAYKYSSSHDYDTFGTRPTKVWRMLVYAFPEDGILIFSRHFPSVNSYAGDLVEDLLVQKMREFHGRPDAIETVVTDSCGVCVDTSNLIGEIVPYIDKPHFKVVHVDTGKPAPSSVTISWSDDVLEALEAYSTIRCCACCGIDLGEDEIDNFVNPETGEQLCESCFNEIFFICDNCGNICNVRDGIGGDHGDMYCCEDCFHENYIECEECDCTRYINSRSLEYHIHVTDTESRIPNTEGRILCVDCIRSKLLNGDTLYATKRGEPVLLTLDNFLPAYQWDE